MLRKGIRRVLGVLVILVLPWVGFCEGAEKKEIGGYQQSNIATFTTVADLEIGGYTTEKNHNKGAKIYIRVKAYQGIPFFGFDLNSLKKRKVISARLFVRAASWESETFTLTCISTIAAPWVEGKGIDQIIPGASCYNYAQYDTVKWAGPGSNAQDVIMGNGGSLVNSKGALTIPPFSQGFGSIEIDPELIQAIIDGEQYGLALYRKMDPDYENWDISSREAGHPAYLVVEHTEGDTTPPSVIKDLSASSGEKNGEIGLSWTAPGDDGTEGKAKRYDVRYSTSPITESVWEYAEIIKDAPLPKEAGTLQSLIISGLSAGIYYFAAKTEDEAGNVSSISNIASAPPCKDKTFPTPISDLRAFSASSLNGAVALCWTASGDDGNIGRAESYEIGWADFKITEENWNKANKVAYPPKPEDSGSLEYFVVRGLSLGKKYYFAIKVKDEAGNSSFSNCAEAFPNSIGINLWAVGDYHRINPENASLIEELSEDYKAKNYIWNGGESKIKLMGGRNEFLAFQLIVEGNLNNIKIDIDFEDIKNELFREWYIKRDGRWYPDALIPFDIGNWSDFDIPDKRLGISSQCCDAVWVDLYIPHNIKPGKYIGTLTFRSDETNPIYLSIQIDVLDFQLPDHLSLDAEINGYGPFPSYVWGKQKDYYRLFHCHRTSLNILPYPQTENLATDYGYAPELSGTGSGIYVKDWEKYDALWGSYFDGSNFTDCPRSKIPVEHAYLPFCLNWPAKFSKWNIEDGYPLKNPPTEEYRNEWMEIARDFCDHFSKKNWSYPQFQVYMNSKKQWWFQPYWDLDEPTTEADYRALAIYSNLMQEGFNDQKNIDFIFRVDIGQYDYLEEQLDGYVGLWNINSGYFRQKKIEERQILGELSWFYGGLSDISYPTWYTLRWPYLAAKRKADGFCIWNYGPATDWKNPTAGWYVVYSGHSHSDINQKIPIPTIWLKVLRRGLQDYEYLEMLKKREGREVVEELLEDLLLSDRLIDYHNLRCNIAEKIDGILPAPTILRIDITEKKPRLSFRGKGERFRIYRSTTRRSWEFVGETKNTEYTDESPISGTSYYAVRAYDGKEESCYSNDVKVKIFDHSKIILKKTAEKNGSLITYTITYKNEGLGTATDVVIIDVLPERCVLREVRGQKTEVSFWYDNKWQEELSDKAEKIRWTIPEVAPGESGSVCFVCEVK